MSRWTRLLQSARLEIVVVSFVGASAVLLFCWCCGSKMSLFQGIFKFTDGRKLPAEFRRLTQSRKGTGSAMADLVGELDGQENVMRTNVKAKKNIQEGYARADSLDKQKLKKYVKALAQEAKLYRNARME